MKMAIIFSMTEEEFVDYLKMYLYYQKAPPHLAIEHAAGYSFVSVKPDGEYNSGAS
jgi:hypothetical protein